MSLAQRYNRILRRQILHFAAWSPVTDPYEVGDYGLLREGVFVKLGNIREFGIEVETQTGNSAPLDFSSTGTRVVRTAAGAEVKAFPQQPIDAQLDIHFDGSDCVYIKTSELDVVELKSIGAIANRLRSAKSEDGREWSWRYRVVHKVYTAKEPTILASSEKDSSFKLTGKADALRQLELGKAAVDIGVEASTTSAIKIVGGTGPVALDLFRVRILGGGTKLLRDAPYELGDEWPIDEHDED